MLLRVSCRGAHPNGTELGVGIAKGCSLWGCPGQGLLVPVSGWLFMLLPSSHISHGVKGDFHSIRGRARCPRPEFLRVSSVVYGAGAYESFLNGQRTDPKLQAFFFFFLQFSLFLFLCVIT